MNLCVLALGWIFPATLWPGFQTSAIPALTTSLPLVSRKSEPTCSLDVTDLELSTVVRTIGDQAKVNVVLLAGSATKVTLRLQEMPVSDVLRHLSAVSGLAMLNVRGTYILAPADQLKLAYAKEWQEQVGSPPAPVASDDVMRTYTCGFVNATQVADALTKVFADQKLIAQVGPGQITPSLASQDTSGSTGKGSGVMTEGGPSSDQGLRIVVLRGPKAVVEAALDLAKKLDIARPQVSIAVQIHDISNDALRELGLSWNYGNVTIAERNTRGINFGSFDRSPLSFGAVIKALQTSNKSKLLAEPNVSVMDGGRAFILIGQRINFPVLIGYSQANTPIFDRKEERVGIYLQVSATVSEGKEVTLSLYPQVSTVSGFLEANGASYPQISTREAQTTMRVRSGETVLMGGLMRDEEIRDMEKVPLLGDIPIFGELFRRRKKTRNSSQVVISITPIVTMPGEKMPASGVEIKKLEVEKIR